MQIASGSISIASSSVLKVLNAEERAGGDMFVAQHTAFMLTALI